MHLESHSMYQAISGGAGLETFSILLLPQGRPPLDLVFTLAPPHQNQESEKGGFPGSTRAADRHEVS